MVKCIAAFVLGFGLSTAVYELYNRTQEQASTDAITELKAMVVRMDAENQMLRATLGMRQRGVEELR